MFTPNAFSFSNALPPARAAESNSANGHDWGAILALDWYNGFEHDPEEAARVRVSLLRELAATREPFVATHLSFPSVCHVAVADGAFRCVPAIWDY